MGVTIKDIAKKTGLSITTISLVLNKRESRIPEKTRQIIENAAQELHYSPNQAAISLSTKKTNLIALIIPRGSFYFAEDLVSPVEHACRNAGYSLCVSLPEGDGDSCLEAIQEALRRGADGIICDSSCPGETFYQAYMELTLKAGTPVSSLAAAGAHLLPNSIVPDHRLGGYLAASHLLELGHRDIAFIGGPGESYAVSDMLLGIGEALEENGMRMPEPWVIRGGSTARFGYEGSAALPGFSASGQERNITAVIAGSDAVAAGLLRRAFEQGIKVPEELSVVGYGNSYSCAELHVPLTTVSIHYDRIARKAVNLIKKLNKNGAALTPELVPPSLILRKSTAGAGSGDPISHSLLPH